MYRGQAEREFKVEVEAIGKVRHKNLVGLLGYCAEGPKRLTLIFCVFAFVFLVTNMFFKSFFNIMYSTIQDAGI